MIENSSNFKFVHLSNHSSFSLLEGVPLVKAISKQAAKLGMPAVAVTDTNNLFGAIEMGKFPSANGVQPIVGMQLGITIGANSKHPELIEMGLLTVLVMNETGWRNIIKLASHASLKAPEGSESQITLEELLERHEGLIILTGNARDGYFGKLLRDEEKQSLAEETLSKLSDIFGDRLYIELQRHGMPEEIAIEPQLLAWAYDKNLPLVATNDCRFLTQADSFAFEVMLGIGDGMTISNQQRRKFTDQHCFKSPEEMCELFSDIPEATANTINIAKRCCYTVPTGINFMPAWLIDENGPDAGREVDDIMISHSRDGLKKRLKDFVFKYPDNLDDNGKISDKRKAEIIKEYDERLDYEIGIITNMGYAGYFLITSDFIKWSKEQDIPVGPGRGSGAGSLVAWVMEITDVDPIPWGLYFERFLNPDRVSLPDFDIDFCQDRRLEVVDYVRRKYGDDCVSQIITFGTLKAKACIRDVGRVLEMPYSQVSKIAAFIPEGPPSIPIDQALIDDERMRAMYDDEEEVKNLLDICMQLEGAYRHASTHAAGVMIADRNIDEICPLYKDARSPMPATQFSMFDAEASGLVKFDFLGLKTLTVIKYCMDMLKAEGVEFDITHVPLDDAKTYEMLRDGNTIGVFQVESKGMTDFLVKMLPDKFQYLSDVIALYRPGPLASGMADDFVECRHGRQDPVYPHPALEEVLKETFGVPVYQEQIMMMARVMAGYTLGGADMLRRAMGKKKPEEMVKQRKIFNEGSAKEHGLSAEESNAIFDLMENFAGYGFNKAHTIAYGLISYQTGYLKANYPLEFMSASMTLDRGTSDKILKFRRELERMEVPLLLPDINNSYAFFKVEQASLPLTKKEEGHENTNNETSAKDPLVGSVRFALCAIKGAGEEAMFAIQKEREENGKFKDTFDLVERISPQFMNKRSFEVLVKSGALDSLEPNRAKSHVNMETYLRYCHTFHEEKNSNQIGLFGGGGDDAPSLARPQIVESNKWDPFELLDNEQQVIGFYLSAHPLDVYKDELRKQRNLKDVVALQSLATGGIEKARVACIINEKRELRTKKGDRMAILTISDSSGQDEVAVFPKTYDEYYEVLEKNKPIFMDLQLGVDEERVRINILGLSDLENGIKKAPTVRIHMQELGALSHIREAFSHSDNKGKTICELTYEKPKLGRMVVKLKSKVDFTRRARLRLESINGVEVRESS